MDTFPVHAHNEHSIPYVISHRNFLGSITNLVIFRINTLFLRVSGVLFSLQF